MALDLLPVSDKPYFSLPLTVDEEYWAGFIHADGYVAKLPINRMSVGQKERHLVAEFLRFLQQDSKITVLSGMTTFGEQTGFQASSSKGVACLRALGIKREPSSWLYSSRHFWRGMIDGDGTVSVERQRGYPLVILCSNKPRDIEAFASWIGLLFNDDRPTPYCNSNKVWYAYVKGGKARALGAYLYEDSYSALPRKRDVALSFRGLGFRSRTKFIQEFSA